MLVIDILSFSLDFRSHDTEHAIISMPVQASQSSLSADGLIQAIDRIASGETTVREETKSIQAAICLEQNTIGTGEMYKQETMDNRECLLRATALLTFCAGE